MESTIKNVFSISTMKHVILLRMEDGVDLPNADSFITILRTQGIFIFIHQAASIRL